MDDDEVEHEWVYIGSDEGACIDFSLVDPKSAEKYGCLVMVLDTGHEDQVHLKNLCKTASAMVGEAPAELHGVTSDAGKAMLAKASDNHKVRDFLMCVLQPAFVDSIVRAFLHTQTAESPVGKFCEWLQGIAGSNPARSSEACASSILPGTSTANKNLAFHIKFWCLKYIPAYALV